MLENFLLGINEVNSLLKGAAVWREITAVPAGCRQADESGNARQSYRRRSRREMIFSNLAHKWQFSNETVPG